MSFLNIFESKKERDARIEREKFDMQINIDLKVRQLEKEIGKIDGQAQAALQKAEAFKNAGNKDGAIDAYKDYLVKRSLRRTMNKSFVMMQQVTTMVKAGNLTNDVFASLKTALEGCKFDPSAINEILAGNEQLKAQFEAVGGMLDATISDGTDEQSAEAWFNSGSPQGNAPQNGTPATPNSTAALNDMQAELDKLKKG